MKNLNFRIAWSILMVLVFIGMFIALAFTNYFSNLGAYVRIPLSIVFLIYAGFRISQIRRDLKDL